MGAHKAAGEKLSTVFKPGHTYNKENRPPRIEKKSLSKRGQLKFKSGQNYAVNSGVLNPKKAPT
jgi:hypothetical protein